MSKDLSRLQHVLCISFFIPMKFDFCFGPNCMFFLFWLYFLVQCIYIYKIKQYFYTVLNPNPNKYFGLASLCATRPPAAGRGGPARPSCASHLLSPACTSPLSNGIFSPLQGTGSLLVHVYIGNICIY